MIRLDIMRLIDAGMTPIYVVESGSRAYGFDSVDSDYDIRGIYKYDSWKEYVRLDAASDQIAWVDGDHDYVFWDIRKALKLLTASNPSIIDWLSSPICYREISTGVTSRLRELAKLYYSPKKYFSANLGLARGHYDKLMRNKERVDSKTYLYTFRALAVCRYVLSEEFAPPINFKFQDHYPEVNALISRRKAGSETEAPECDTYLNMIIRDEIRELDLVQWWRQSQKSVSLEAANEFLCSLFA